MMVGGQETRLGPRLLLVAEVARSADTHNDPLSRHGDPSRFCTTMSRETGYHNRQTAILSKIHSLFRSLDPSTYDEVAPKVEFWIEYALAEHSTTIDELVREVSQVAWYFHPSHPSVSRFLKEFRDAPHRSEQAKSFVDELCSHILRWFAAASAENLSVDPGRHYWVVAMGGGEGFIRAASFVGYLIEWSLLSSDLVRRHLVKPLVAHHYGDSDDAQKSVRAIAIYQLFTAARGSLLQGLLEPEDVQACFEVLDTKITLKGIAGPDAAKLNVRYSTYPNVRIGTYLLTCEQELREFHATWLKQRKEEQRNDAGVREPKGERKNCTMTTEVPAEVETPVTFASENLPATTIDVPSSILRSIMSPSILQDAESFSETRVNILATAISSPTLSLSTISDLTPTEFGNIEDSEEQTIAPHDTFYFEDGDLEIVCGDTIFRVHLTIISFASTKLRDIFSPLTLLNTPMPEGRPRIAVSDSAEDFAVLLKMIYTPG